MFPSPFALAILVSLLSISTPVSATTLYTWRDADGSIMFTDSPRGAPPDVQVRVWAKVESVPSPPTPPVTPALESTPVPDPPVIGAQSAQPVTQGEFAVHLAEELALGEHSDEDEAADLLSRIRIAPRLGRWELDQPMTPELTLRLRNLTVASAAEGWIAVTPEEGLLAFDTTAALLGVTIPETVDSDASDEDALLPVADTPPLVYVAEPPVAVSPYYVWQPWPGGYWWNGVIVSGVFVLDVDRFVTHRHQHRRHHDAALAPDRIGHRVQRHVAKSRHVFKDASRPDRHWRPAGSNGSTPSPRVRVLAPGSRPDDTNPTRQPASVHRNKRPRSSIVTSDATANRPTFSTHRSSRIERHGEGARPSHVGGRGFSRN